MRKCKNQPSLYYYEKITNSCQKYFPNMCGINKNNFKTRKLCEKSCGLSSEWFPKNNQNFYSLIETPGL